MLERCARWRRFFCDYRDVGDELWTRFSGGRDGTLWYYRSLVDAFAAAEKSRLVDELDRTVSEIERLAGVPKRGA